MKTKIIPVTEPIRRWLPDTRMAINQKLTIATKEQVYEAYVTVGMSEDGKPMELFVHMDKEGSTLSGLLDDLSIATSLLLQYGVPLDKLVKKFAYQSFEPSGRTNIPEVPFAKSITDLVFRWMAYKFIPDYGKEKEDGAAKAG